MPEQTSSAQAVNAVSCPADSRSWPARRWKLAWLPIPLLLAVIAGLWVADLRTVYESRTLMVLLNLFFTWLASLCICVWAARAFLSSGQPGLLMFGCGSLLWGVTSLAAAVVVDRVNPTITVHNLGVLGAASCHLIGLLWRGRLPRPGRWLVVGYAAALFTSALIFCAAMAGWTPLFFVQGQGGTPLREVVLFLATAMFAWVAWQMICKFWRQSGTFYYWYGLGLALTATGLTGVMLLTVQGGILGWTNRLTQYLGSAYLVIAALMAARGTAPGKFSLTAVDEALKTDWFMVGWRRQGGAQRWWIRYGLAVVVAAAAYGLRSALTLWVGPGLPPYITFYPAMMGVALLAGLGPGLMATALMGLIAEYWFLPPVGQFAVASPVDRLGLVIFIGTNLIMCGVAELYRRNRQKAAAYDCEAALHESEERFRMMFEGHGAPMLLIEPGAGSIVDANHAAVAFYGYSRAQLRSMRISQINQLPPEEIAARRQNAVHLSENQFIFPHRLADGQIRWVEVYSSPVTIQGQPMLFSIIHDITARRQAEEALRESQASLEARVKGRTAELEQAVSALRQSEQEFRSLAEAMPQIVWATRADGWNIYFNHQWVDYTGMTMEESYGHGWNVPFHPDDQKRAWDAWQRATNHNEPYSLECRLRRADGAYRWWLVRGSPMLGANGEILKWFGTCTDIEEIKNAEAALREANDRLEQRVAERTVELRESEERFRLALKNAPVSVAIQDCNLVFQWAYNQRTRRPDEIIGKTDADLFAPEDIPGILEAKRRVLESGTDVHVQHWLTSNGRRLFLDLYYEPLRDAAGEITGIGIAIVDLTEQKRAEEALRESEERHRLLAETMLQGVVHQDAGGQIIAMNPAAERILGKTREAFLGSSSVRAEHDTLREDGSLFPGLEHPAMVALRTGQSVRGVVMGVFNPMLGAYRWISIDAVPVCRPGSARPVEVYTVFEDITERRQAAEALRQSEALLRSVLEQMPSGVTVRDAGTGNLIMSNAQAQRLMGPLVPSINDYSAYKAFHPDGRSLSNDEWPMARAASTGEIVKGEDITYRQPRGTDITLRISAAPIRDSAGQVVAAVAVFDDISERKRAEEALRASEQRYRTLFESLQEGFYLSRVIFDNEGRPCDIVYQDVNPAFERIMGLPRDRIVGRTAKELIPAMKPGWLDVFSRVQLTGKPAQYDSYSEQLQKHFEAFIFRPAPGQFAVLVSDITERKRAEAALREADHRKEVLLKEIHHRVKNNMQVISSLVSLQAGGMQDPAVREVLRDMTDRVRSMALVHEKLYQSADLARVDFAEYTRSLLSYLWRAHGNAVPAVKLTLELEPVLLSVEAAVPCGLILNELAGNALKHAFHGRSEGEVTVALRGGADGRVRLSVRDNGVGMPAELDWRRARSLGLRLVQMLTSQLDGTVEICVNDGTEFEIAFSVSGKQL